MGSFKGPCHRFIRDVTQFTFLPRHPAESAILPGSAGIPRRTVSHLTFLESELVTHLCGDLATDLATDPRRLCFFSLPSLHRPLIYHQLDDVKRLATEMARFPDRWKDLAIVPTATPSSLLASPVLSIPRTHLSPPPTSHLNLMYPLPIELL